MEIIYDKKALTAMIHDIANLTGITMSIYDYAENWIANSRHFSLFCMTIHGHPRINHLCKNCSNNLYLKSRESLKYEECICPMGLYEACVPILIDGVWAGHIALAGVRTEDSEKHILLRENESYDLFYNQPFYTQWQIDSLKNILPKIIFDTAIRFVYNDQIDEITTYIKNNLSEKLSIEHLCDKFHISKNTIYTLFKHNLSTTVNEYISDKRIEKAKNLLRNDESGEKIIEEIGLENYSYFCRLFKKKTGVSPSFFRKILKGM